MKYLPGLDLLDNAFDSMFDDSRFFNKSAVMKTDVSLKDGQYLLDMELPGFNKEDIHIDLKDGYLNISASRNVNNEEKDDKGNIVRQERYSGSCSRSFYVGDVKEEDIKASYQNGELKITFPEEAKRVETQSRIMID